MILFLIDLEEKVVFMSMKETATSISYSLFIHSVDAY